MYTGCNVKCRKSYPAYTANYYMYCLQREKRRGQPFVQVWIAEDQEGFVLEEANWRGTDWVWILIPGFIGQSGWSRDPMYQETVANVVRIETRAFEGYWEVVDT